MTDHRLFASLPIDNVERLPPSLAKASTWDLNRCTRFLFEDDGSARTATMEMTGDQGVALTLRLVGIHSLRLPEIAMGFWLPELEIQDVVDRQWEGVRRLIHSPATEDAAFACYCERIEYVPPTGA